MTFRFALALLLLNLTSAAQRRTFITRTGNKETSQMLFISSLAGDSLSVKNGGGKHIYRLVTGKNVYLIADEDSLKITFDDTRNMVRVNRDTYQLFPAYYIELKQALIARHSVMAALRLLEDTIGDYPIDDALPLLWFDPQPGKRIAKATVITQRSQADMTDTWRCTYRYKGNRLSAVAAKDGEIRRFTKTINYLGPKVSKIQTYRNIEDRQVTDLSVTYRSNKLRWQQETLETGKNRTTEYLTTLKRIHL